MSLTEISVRVAIVTLLALVALIAIGWRRSAPDYPRGASGRRAATSAPRSDPTAISIDDARAATEVDHVGRVATRKVFDVIGLGSIAVFIGIVIALVVSTAIAWMVTALLDRL